MQNETRLLPSARHKEEAHKSSGSTRYQNLFSSILALPLLAHVFPATAQVQAPHSTTVPAANAVLAIFSDRPMSDEFWPIIVSALHEELASGAPETRFLPGQTVGADPAVQILRGDKIAPGFNADNPITIYLHGDCVVLPFVSSWPALELRGFGMGSAQPWTHRTLCSCRMHSSGTDVG